MRDENSLNETWLEAAKENHEQAIMECDWEFATAIEKDVFGAGFSGEAKILAETRQHFYEQNELMGEDESDALREVALG